MLRSLLSAFLVFAAALLVVGFTLSTSTGGRADFRFTNGTEPKSLDPQLATGEIEHRLLTAIFEGLARLDARSLEPVPGVAESWDISADGKTYTFHLRPNARWSDGRPLTAQDFCYAWRRLQEPSLGAEYAYIMHMVRYAQAYNTHAAQASALQGPIQAALAELLQKYPGPIPAAAVLAWPAEVPGTTAWLVVAALAFVCTGLALVMYFRLIAHAGPANAISVTYLIPIFAIAWGSLFLDEKVTWPLLVGCAVVFLGTALATGMVGARKARQPA